MESSNKLQESLAATKPHYEKKVSSPNVLETNVLREVVVRSQHPQSQDGENNDYQMILRQEIAPNGTVIGSGLNKKMTGIDDISTQNLDSSPNLPAGGRMIAY